jgi:hypothetical protein
MHLEIMVTVRKLAKAWRTSGISSPKELVQLYLQKPSSARPTQLNTKIEQTTAATEAIAAMAFPERMTRTRCKSEFCPRIRAQ